MTTTPVDLYDEYAQCSDRRSRMFAAERVASGCGSLTVTFLQRHGKPLPAIRSDSAASVRPGVVAAVEPAIRGEGGWRAAATNSRREPATNCGGLRREPIAAAVPRTTDTRDADATPSIARPRSRCRGDAKRGGGGNKQRQASAHLRDEQPVGGGSGGCGKRQYPRRLPPLAVADRGLERCESDCSRPSNPSPIVESAGERSTAVVTQAAKTHTVHPPKPRFKA